MKVVSYIVLAALVAGSRAFAQSSPADAPAALVDEVVVTASPLARSAYDSALPVSSLSGARLDQVAAPTLGESLRSEPGIASSRFTAGASRPIIRGLADNRVIVLNDGMDILDVSSLSPDHAPSLSPLLSQRIEVVRGAATILYGSSAIGGVVNVIDNRIPSIVPEHTISGELGSRFNTVDLERSGALAVDVALTRHWVLHLDGSILRTEDVTIPGHALSENLRRRMDSTQRARGDRFGGDPDGAVPNTGVFTRDFGAGLSYIWDGGFVGVSFNQFLSEYGVPTGLSEGESGAVPERVRLDITKRQYSLHAGLNDPFPGFTSADLKFTFTDYEHSELDGAAVGSTFLSRGFDSRVELVHAPVAGWEGSIGGQGFYRELSVLGDEAFLQPTRTLQVAGFAFEELHLDPFRLQAGARIEYNAVDIDSDNPELTSLRRGEGRSRDFVPVSAALGAIYDFTDSVNAALTARYSERAPTAEELYARGPHDATGQFLVGDPSLGKERVLGVDLSLRKKKGVVTGSAGLFFNHFFDFIDFTDTGVEEDGLPVYDYADKRADFWGAELLVDFHLLPRSVTRAVAPSEKGVKDLIAPGGGDSRENPHDLYLEFKGDYVHAQNLTDNEPLPRITPLRLTGALAYAGPVLGARIEVERVQSQDRVAAFESASAGYTFLNADLSYNLVSGPVAYNFYVRGTNLTDERARDHTSFLKDILPLAGRGVVIGVKASF